MKEKHCKLEFCKVSVGEVKNYCYRSIMTGIDHLDGKLLRMVADSIANRIGHIFNLSLEEMCCPQAWREATVIQLPKSGKAFTGSNSRPISLLPALNKLLEKMQHAYIEGHLTCTALTQMTDDWLKEIGNKKIVGAVLLNFSAAFDIIYHNLLLKKYMCYGFSTISWIQSDLSNITLRGCFNGRVSNVKHVKGGVPQGSSPGSLLFYFYH